MGCGHSHRAIMEGSVKFVYLLLGTPEEVKEKAVEYWETLPANGAAKHSERAKAFLKDVCDPDSSQWLPFHELVIADEEIRELRAGTNREQRQRLEQKWSFSGITQQFVGSESKGLRLLAHLAHGYGMSSHLMHKDGDGVGMVWERSIRSPERRDAARFGHSSRIVSDICSFTALRASFLLRHCGRDPSVLSGLQEKYDALFSELRVAADKFTATEYGVR